LALIDELKKQAQTAADTFRVQTFELAAQTVEQEIKALWDKYDKAKKEYEQEYLDLIETNANSLKTRYDNAVAQINSLNDLLDNLKSKVDAATEANKRMVMETSQKDYYRL